MPFSFINYLIKKRTYKNVDRLYLVLKLEEN